MILPNTGTKFKYPPPEQDNVLLADVIVVERSHFKLTCVNSFILILLNHKLKQHKMSLHLIKVHQIKIFGFLNLTLLNAF